MGGSRRVGQKKKLVGECQRRRGRGTIIPGRGIPSGVHSGGDMCRWQLHSVAGVAVKTVVVWKGEDMSRRRTRRAGNCGRKLRGGRCMWKKTRFGQEVGAEDDSTSSSNAGGLGRRWQE